MAPRVWHPSTAFWATMEEFLSRAPPGGAVAPRRLCGCWGQEAEAPGGFRAQAVFRGPLSLLVSSWMVACPHCGATVGTECLGGPGGQLTSPLGGPGHGQGLSPGLSCLGPCCQALPHRCCRWSCEQLLAFLRPSCLTHPFGLLLPVDRQLPAPLGLRNVSGLISIQRLYGLPPPPPTPFQWI